MNGAAEPDSTNGGFRMPCVTVAVISTIIICLFIRADARGQSFSLTGYWKNYSTVMHQPDVTGLARFEGRPLMGSVSNRLRLTGRLELVDELSVSAAYDISPRIQDHELFSGPLLEFDPNVSAYRAEDFDRRLYPENSSDVSSFAIYHNLDRLFFTMRLDWADIYVGRQAIAWGSARVINPTDIFVPYMFNELDVEDRIGVDAARMRIPVGMMSEIDAGFLFGDELMMAKSAWYIRGRQHILQSDVTAMVVGFRRNLMVGLDVARSIGGAGAWLEVAQVIAGVLDSPDREPDDDYLRGSIGCDYSLRDGTYLFIEYHYNQAGASDPRDYLEVLGTTAYTDGAVYLLGEHYLAPGIMYPITPLISLTGQVLANLDDPSVFLMASSEYNIAENIYISGGTYVGLGENPEYNPVINSPIGRLDLRSEFGVYPDIFFVSFRIYF